MFESAFMMRIYFEYQHKNLTRCQNFKKKVNVIKSTVVRLKNGLALEAIFEEIRDFLKSGF